MMRRLAIAFAVLAGSGAGDAMSMPNPASAYCIERGGRLEIRAEAGGEVGYCHLPDGRVVEEWEFYRASDGGRN